MSIRILSPELAHKASKELGEDAQRLSDGIKSLKEWITKQPHLCGNVRTDDQWLASFLRGCKFRIEITKSKFDMYYTLRSLLPELREKMDPFAPRIKDILAKGIMLMLPKRRTPESATVILLRTGITQLDEFTQEETGLYYQMIYLYLLLKDDNAVVSGLEFIIDIKNTPVEVAKYVTIQNVKKFQAMIEKALPFRYKTVHYVNAPQSAEVFFSFIRGFMNEKAKSRLFVHSNVEDVYSKFPRDLLPKEYGGDSFTIQDAIDYTKSKIESIKEVYAEEIYYRTNEKLRCDGKSISSDILFGVDGNFRKLEYD